MKTPRTKERIQKEIDAVDRKLSRVWDKMCPLDQRKKILKDELKQFTPAYKTRAGREAIRKEVARLAKEGATIEQIAAQVGRKPGPIKEQIDYDVAQDAFKSLERQGRTFWSAGWKFAEGYSRKEHNQEVLRIYRENYPSIDFSRRYWFKEIEADERAAEPIIETRKGQIKQKAKNQ